jgi:osmotically-inducible protein OsmY
MKTPTLYFVVLASLLTSCQTDVSAEKSNKPLREQLENEEDRALSSAVRRAIMQTESLSTHAKNIRISASEAIVQLNGVVDNEAEKQEISRLANSVRGVKKVDNYLKLTDSQED